ncbi:cardiolipin synthase [Pontiella agarivorans]|uniref:Cardiolipin synthase n=1 Tax=Pontiella agarivorans TaxID=3038953 RepID=A0ABU5MT47_9BACT|nr:cardiolipin synthase [Pontiella agarivorans]MDZ8117381.1 cardiolipin synthase [Pontiella agarivorans]
MISNSSDLTFWVVFSTMLHLCAFIGVTLHALQRRRHASSTVLWIFLAWSFPLIGPLVYLSFGIDRVSIKGLERQLTNQMLMKKRDARLAAETPLRAWHLDYCSASETIENRMSRKLNQAVDAIIPEHPLLSSNAVFPLASGDAAYPLMLQSIRSAKHHIHMQSFIIHRDETGRMLLDALKKKAEEGVKVRLLFDRFGSTHAYLGGMFRKYRNIPNFEICGWTQANPLKAQFQINLRNHRKNLVVDGRIAFFGGVNISSENVTSNGRKAIRDYHFKVEGPMVHELQLSFLSDWFFMTRESVDDLLQADLFPEIISCGNVNARLIDSGPSSAPGLLAEVFFNAIVEAQEQILIVSPYFVPSSDIIQAVRSAARRGVDVRIVVPKQNNHRYAGMASKALYEELLDAGVRIFHRNPPFIHAKAMVIDTSVALVGTANIDIRSLELNYETTALFEEQNAVTAIKRMIKEDIADSSEVDLNEWLNRPRLQKLGENLCALMTPVL